MPQATIWRDASLVNNKKAVLIRDVVQLAVQTALKVELDEVEVRVRNIGPLDINYMPIEIDTGTGRNGWRVGQRELLATEIARRIHGADVLEPEWIGPDRSYVRIRICESSFVPIGHANHVR